MKFTLSLLLWMLCTIALLPLNAVPLFAGSAHQGTVRFNDLPVPGATATAASEDNKYVTVTNGDGVYFFPDLDEGVWSIRVEMTGFQTVSRDVVIGPDRSEMEWELTMLSMPEIETVSIDTLSLDKLPGFQIAELNPLSDILTLTPDAGLPETPSIFANLTDEELSEQASDSFLINGSVNNSADSPFAQRAAFGNNRQTRSLYNGSFGLVLDNSAFDARPFSLTGRDIPRPDYNRSRISVNFGGPLVLPYLKNQRPWFFVGYQRVRERDVTVQTSRMPTLEERSGDLSSVMDSLGRPIPIFDPETGLQFENNVIPEDRLSPQALSLLSLYPMPNITDAGQYNHQVPLSDNTHRDSMQGRINWRPVMVQFNYQTSRTDNSDAFGFLDTGRARSIGVNVNYGHRFSRFLSMTLGYQFARSTDRVLPYFADRMNVSELMGINGNNREPENWGPPNLSFSNYQSLTEAQHWFHRNMTNGLAVAFSFYRGDHTVSFGFDFSRQQENQLSQQNARGTFAFTGAGTGYDFAGFLLGIPDASAIAFGNADKYFRASRYAAYLNDDWRVSSGFSLNIGIRWEYESPFIEKYGRLVNLDIDPGFEAVSPTVAYDPTGTLTGNSYPDSLISPDKSGIQPRIGFAWRPIAASSLVVRGGYGIYRNTNVYLPIAMQMAQQSPLSKSMSVSNSPENPLTLADGFNALPDDVPNTYAIDPDFRVAFSQTWQLSIQRDLPLSIQMVATYLGTKGSRLVQRSIPNTYPEGDADGCTDCPSGFVYTESNGSSIRHEGSVQLRRRLGNGFTANVQYTLSKSLDDGGINSSVIAQDWLNLKSERALSDFDRRHEVNIAAQYTSGAVIYGPGLMSGWKGALLKEWTISANMIIGSGNPLTPVYSSTVSRTGISGSIRPSATGESVYDAPAGLYLNPAAYVPPASGEWGNAGRNSITGPNQFSLDASLGRAFRLRDRYNIEFRLESSNILNHVTFPDWNTTINSSQFGLPDQANPMRRMQINIRVSF
jgi:hypothetical protein